MKLFVDYEVGPPIKQQPTAHSAGPYATQDEADTHKHDIAGYVGVSKVWIREQRDEA